jgi:hypothetical protein
MWVLGGFSTSTQIRSSSQLLLGVVLSSGAFYVPRLRSKYSANRTPHYFRSDRHRLGKAMAGSGFSGAGTNQVSKRNFDIINQSSWQG